MVELNERYAALEVQKLRVAAQKVGQENHNTERKLVEGIGQHVARIPVDEYYAAKGFYGEMCWNDPDFVRAWLRDNPHCRVKTTRGTRGQELPKGTLFLPRHYAAK